VRASPAVAAALAVVLVACGGGDDDVEPIGDDAPTATPTDDAASEEPEQAPDEPEEPEPAAFEPAQVPDDLATVDVEAAQTIVDQLDERLGVLADVVASEDGFGEEAELQLRSLYTTRAAGETRGIWEQVLLPNLPEDPGPPVTTVTEVVGRGPDCVVVEADRDYAPLGAGDDLAGRTWTLALTPAGEGPDERNPTVWLLDTEAAATDVDVPCLGEEAAGA
jgi:hypothetical protein